MTDDGRGWSGAVPEPARSCQGERAGLVSRALAAVIDIVVVVVSLGVTYVAVCGLMFAISPAHFTFPLPSRTVVLEAAAVLAVAYLTVAWAGTGRTVGGQLLGLRVVNRKGNHVHPVIAVLRAVCCLAFPIGLVLAAGPGHRSLADLILRTSVVYDWDPRSRLL